MYSRVAVLFEYLDLMLDASSWVLLHNSLADIFIGLFVLIISTTN